MLAYDSGMVVYRRVLSRLRPTARQPGPAASAARVTDLGNSGAREFGSPTRDPVPAGAPAPGASSRFTRVAVNVTGAVFAAFFAYASLEFVLRTHQLLGAGFLVEQTWFVLAFLIRRPAQAVTRRTSDWLLALGGTFGGTLFRPQGFHPAWGNWTGIVFQVAGLLIGLTAVITLGRSFGMAPADRGLVTRGPYAIVRHPIYISYLLVESGYLLQALSWANAAVAVFTAGCNIGRALAEERLLMASAVSQGAGAPAGHDYPAYRNQVRWRLVPGVWL